VIADLGGFDENFIGPSGDDAEFSHRVRKRGTILYTPAAHLVHLKASSGGLRDSSGQARYIWQTAFCITYSWFKIETPPRVRYRMTLRTFRQEVLNRRTLCNGQWLPFALAFLRGIRDSERVIRPRRAQGMVP
jgi:GT2 family glycosyltransferase